MKQILEDEREIIAIYWDAPDGRMRKGDGGITAIKVYGEPGEYGYVPFLAIMRGDVIWQRMTALHVRIVYKIEGDEA